MKTFRTYLLLLPLIAALPALAQVMQPSKIQKYQKRLDSLGRLPRSLPTDTNILNCYIGLSGSYLYSSPDSALLFAQKAFDLAEQRGWEKGKSRAYMNLGNAQGIMGNYPLAVDYFLKALRITEKLGDKLGTERMLTGLGIVYKRQGDYEHALGCYFKALEMARELQNEEEMATHYGNIGVTYKNMANQPRYNEAQKDSLYHLALDFHFRALALDVKGNNKMTVARHYGNIGVVYDKLHDDKKALDYFFRALKLDEELKNRSGIATMLGNLGAAYTDDPSLPPPPGERLKGLALAEKFLLRCMAINHEIHVLDDERDDNISLSRLYDKMGRYELSLKYYKEGIRLRDTLYSQERSKELTRKELNYEFEKKEMAEKSEQDKKDAIAAAEGRKQKIILVAVLGCLLLVGIFAIFILRGYREKQRANIEITWQKALIEEKQKEILDSIQYAKKIQHSLLPSVRFMDRCLQRTRKGRAA